MNCRFRVVGRLDAASRVQEGTVTISRTAGTFAVRPLRRRREDLLPLSTVAAPGCEGVLKAEPAGARWMGVTAVQHDGMVALDTLPGWFAPSLFRRIDAEAAADRCRRAFT